MSISTIIYAITWLLILVLPNGNIYAAICLALGTVAFAFSIAERAIAEDRRDV